jgi:mannose-6-phosphate isomerase
MTIERASGRPVAKPWGSAARLPWSSAEPGNVIGEIWFERDGQSADTTSLLLKLLFTQRPLSIQVHPDDAMAHAMGLPRGKTEAWYVLSAEPGATLARGLRKATTPDELRTAIGDGSIQQLVEWQAVQADETVAIPAGTIHALGAGLIVAELQQRSDTTFRLFDFGRDRTLQVDPGVAAARCIPSDATPPPRQLTPERMLLMACPYFVFEHIELGAGSSWEIDATVETWLLVIDGSATIGPVAARVGEAVFLDQDRAVITPGAAGMTALIGMAASVPAQHFLTEITFPHLIEA